MKDFTLKKKGRWAAIPEEKLLSLVFVYIDYIDCEKEEGEWRKIMRSRREISWSSGISITTTRITRMINYPWRPERIAFQEGVEEGRVTTPTPSPPWVGWEGLIFYTVILICRRRLRGVGCESIQGQRAVGVVGWWWGWVTTPRAAERSTLHAVLAWLLTYDDDHYYHQYEASLSPPFYFPKTL